MSVYPSREKRQTVWLGARLKSRGDWCDMTIGNVSTHGIVGLCRHALEPGERVEVRCGSFTIHARVVWTRHDRFGAAVERPIVVEDLLRASLARPQSGERRQILRELADEGAGSLAHYRNEQGRRPVNSRGRLGPHGFRFG
ncbi:hypothetical protein [Altererythrobacter sp. B11]|uniref:hypothetical protein n=1 Tax=Altererythrobacter sp. B11 TaxID=2060312 RepID=UPI000E5AA514|nr:hypothetical protein [Altererythrobacter sp. B11]